MAHRTRRPLVAGNWKMHGSAASIAEVRLLVAMLDGVGLACDVMICPPATLIGRLCELVGDAPIAIGAQDCHAEPSGAHTGDIAAEMLRDAGASAVIVGHSERRSDHGEDDAAVRAKAAAAHRAGLTAIVCVGETLDEHDAGRTLDVVAKQLDASLPDGATPSNTVIAYEPVWAIGTGRTPTVDDIGSVHGRLREVLSRRLGADNARGMRILYGGSVNAGNAKALLAAPDVDGALVGSASLQAKDFLGIVAVYGT